MRLKSLKRALICLYLYLALADSRWYITFALQPHLSLISALLRSFVARFDIAALAWAATPSWRVCSHSRASTSSPPQPAIRLQLAGELCARLRSARAAFSVVLSHLCMRP